MLQQGIGAVGETKIFRCVAAPRRAASLLRRLCYGRLGYLPLLAWRMVRTRSCLPLREWWAERIIKRSGLFDKDWYLKDNPDVLEWGINPVRHYVVFGANEGRDPSSLFSTRRYLDENGDVARAGMNPLAHFVLYGAAEGRAGATHPQARRQYPLTTKSANADGRVGLKSTLALVREAVRFSGGTRTLAATIRRVLRDEGLSGLAYRINLLNEMRLEAQGAFDPIRPTPRRPGRLQHVRRRSVADIIVCGHNTLDDVRTCLESVVARTTPPYRLIIVDDGSDELISSFLGEFIVGQPGLLLRGEKELGYPRAANVGFRSSTAEFIVLLNSNTTVAPLWLDRLIACAESDEQIGIVGSSCDIASLQSVQGISENGRYARNVLPDGLNVGDMASLVSDCRAYPRFGFLNGFCLLVRRALLDEIGYFDDDVFGTGHGERSDYCLRATEAGWKLAGVKDTYVCYAQSKSSSDEQRVKLWRPYAMSDLTKAIADDWRHHGYYSEAECWLDEFWKDGSIFRFYFDQLNTDRMLELACGHGRHAAQIIDKIGHLTLVDVNQENITSCRSRFSGHSNITYVVNNGADLRDVASGSQTGAFCYDSMVHFEADVVISYLGELARILTRGGRAVLHYSNMHWMPGSQYGDGPHMRNFFSEAMMIHFSQRVGFRVIGHSTLDWGRNPVWRNLDGLVLLEKSAAANPASSVA